MKTRRKIGMWIMIIGVISVFLIRFLDIPEEAFTGDPYSYYNYFPISGRLIVALLVLIIGLIMFWKK